MSFRTGSARRRSGIVAFALLACVGLLGACSSDDSSSDTTTTADSGTSTTAATTTLTILVSNDDGVGAEGIDVLVTALEAMPDTDVVVSAPAENQSGSGGKTTPGTLTATPTTMLSGTEATAVTGFPADSVNWALDGGIPATPQLVVTGINSGQNLGALIPVSGTIGAARAAASKGIPALAVSAGLNDTAGYEAAARLAVEWIEAHRVAILDGSMATMPAPVTNINVPDCSAGELRSVLEVPAASSPPANFDPVDCAAPAPAVQPVDDVSAVASGYASQSDIGL